MAKIDQFVEVLECALRIGIMQTYKLYRVSISLPLWDSGLHLLSTY